MTHSSESNTTLRSPWLVPVQVLWILLSAVAVVLFIIGFSNSRGAPAPSCTTPDTECSFFVVSQEDAQVAEQMGLPVSMELATSSIPFLLTRIGYILIALLVFWRKSNDWAALLFSSSLMLGILEGVVESTGALKPVASLLYGIAAGFFALLPFVFPNGRFQPRWTRWIAIPFAVAEALILAIFPTSFLNSLLWSAMSVLAIYAIVYRYRRVSNAVERQQTKWAVAGLLVIFVFSLFVFGVSPFFPASQPTRERVVFVLINGFLYPGTTIAFLILFAISILRYRLWDIDIIIRRTLIYSILSGLLALTYFGGVVVLQGLFTAVTGQQSPVVLVLSTLAIAALFFPLRNRVQDFIDRRFFRKKYDAAKVIAEFAATCRDETDLDKLTARLVEVVEETMQPESVSLWLKETGRKRGVNRDDR